MNMKKAISPVVAMALLLVVAVVSVVGFQNWFGAFSSDVFSDAEQRGDTATSGGIVGVETLVGNSIYVKNSGDSELEIKVIKVNGVECVNSAQNLSTGVHQIPISDCANGLTGKLDVVIVTEDEILEKKSMCQNLQVWIVHL